MMKKTYTKPQIVFESFQLTANIAGDCNTKPNIANEATCGYIDDNGWIIFQNSAVCNMPASAVCIDVQVGPDGKHNGLCYHVPTGDMSVFTS